jgi:integrase/recombinase XerD
MRGRKPAFRRGGTYHRLRLPLATAISVVFIPAGPTTCTEADSEPIPHVISRHLSSSWRRRHVSCLGNGRKLRITPLTSGVVAVMRVWLAERAGQTAEPVFPTQTGKALSRDALQHRPSKYVQIAAHTCPPLGPKAVTMRVLRHTAEMRLLRAGIDTSVIAPWLGHERIETTQIHLHADLELKERALAKTTPSNIMPGCYRPPDKLLAILEAL